MPPDAFQDIIYRSGTYEGAIDSIKPFIEFIDGFFVMVITSIAFMIISMALLRNAITGLYCTFPRFFDKIAEAKSGLADKRGNGGMGIFFWIISLPIPNIRPLCDIAEDEVGSPRHFFTKALWEGIVAVFIGTIIYNGYYRDLIGKGASFGAHIVVSYILPFDLEGQFDRAVNTGQNWKFTYNVNAPGGKERNSLAKAIYDAVQTHYDNDIRDTDSRAALGAMVERLMQENLEALSSDVPGCSNWWQLMAAEGWKFSHTVRVMSIEPSALDTTNLPHNIRNEQVIIPISQFNAATPKKPTSDAYMNIILQATQEDVKLGANGGMHYVEAQAMVWTDATSGKVRVALPEGVNGAGNLRLLNKHSFMYVPKVSGSQMVFEFSDTDGTLSAELLAAGQQDIQSAAFKYQGSVVSTIHFISGTESDIKNLKVRIAGIGDWVDKLSREDLQKSSEERVADTGGNSGEPAPAEGDQGSYVPPDETFEPTVQEAIEVD